MDYPCAAHLGWIVGEDVAEDNEKYYAASRGEVLWPKPRDVHDDEDDDTS